MQEKRIGGLKLRKITILLPLFMIIGIGIFIWNANHNEISQIDVDMLHNTLENKEIMLLDVRESDEYKGGHIEAAVNVPLSSFDAETLPYEKDEPLYVICRSGNRSMEAAQRLHDAGYTDVTNVTGGMLAWDSK